MTYVAPLLVLAASFVLMWFCCVRPMRNHRDGGCCAPTQDQSTEIDALRQEIADLRRWSE